MTNILPATPEFIPVSPHTEAWHEIRRKGIGGSDVACLFGLGFEGRSAFTLYQEKRGELPPQPDNWHMRRGRAMEPEIRQHYRQQTGRPVETPEGVFIHPRYKHMLANLDGIVSEVGGGRLLEVKTARMRNGWGDPGTDQIPEPYLLQVQHYLCVMGFPVADICVSFGFDEPELFHVEADPEIHEMLIEAEQSFWDNVQAGNPPDPGSAEEASRKFRRPISGTVTAGLAEQAAHAKIKAAKSGIAAYEDEIEENKLIIMNALGENDTLIAPDGTTLVTWKLRRGAERINGKRLKQERPEIYQAYAETGEDGRTFLVK